MYFNFDVYEVKEEERLLFTPETDIHAPSSALENELKQVFAASVKGVGRNCRSITLSCGIPECYGVSGEEAYVISLGEESNIYGGSERALLYAVSTLRQLAEEDRLCSLLICDSPVCAFRGYRTFTPGRDGLEDFCKIIDMLAYYKYNTLFIEVGGAMEYKRHPEINLAWERTCKEVTGVPGKKEELFEDKESWPKDAPNMDNGGGSYITQEEMRSLIQYANKCGLEVIPEVPSLSHSYYLLFAHPELKERAEDMYPDTYCPSNPKTYELLFDVLDEVAEVFKPRYINIGHDECYSLGCCPLCRDKDPVVLYADDIKKIHGYITGKGIGVMMWGDNLLDIRLPGGVLLGGAPRIRTNPDTGEEEEFIKPLYPCRGMLPKDIIMLNWYWNHDPYFDKVYYDNGYRMVLGNVRTTVITHWKDRLAWGAEGSIVSNWGSNDWEDLQRNIVTYEIVYSAYSHWCTDFCDEMKQELMEKAFREAYRYLHPESADMIRVKHTTDLWIKYHYFFDAPIDDETYKLGDYVLTYADGSEERLPVKYGTNISCKSLYWDSTNIALLEPACSSVPIRVSASSHQAILQLSWGHEIARPEAAYDVWYETAYPNPRKGQKPIDIRFEKTKDGAFSVEYEFLKEEYFITERNQKNEKN